MILDTYTLDLIDTSVLCWLATLGKNDEPSVSPKELWSTYGDDSLVIADIASANSVTNIRNHSKVCVSFIDIFRQKGMKLYGSAQIVSRDSGVFPDVSSKLLQMAGDKFNVRHVIHVRIERGSKIVAPSYKLFPDIHEETMMQDAYETYGVVPAS